MAVGRDRARRGLSHQTWLALRAAAMAVLLVVIGVPPRHSPTAHERPELTARSAPQPSPTAAYRFPTVPLDHTHALQLLANAMRYAAPENRITDPASGYPYEGWNHDPDRGLLLRSFTQLTAIGLWMELLANVAAGQADTPYLSREQSLAGLARIVTSLREDQKDPELGRKGLLGNFLVLGPDRRLGSLTADVDRRMFLEEFGPDRGHAIWNALVAAGQIAPRDDGDGAEVKREGQPGEEDIHGSVLPEYDAATRQRVLAILDRRTVKVVFGDNANLSSSAAKTIGALLRPEVRDRPEAAALRDELERFLDAQREGYAELYDAALGLFYFGWDGQRHRWIGSELRRGVWEPDRQDYLVNEFRGPATFVAVRFGLPTAALRNLGFQLKPYRTEDGREVYTLAPWEGNAFQVLGLDVQLNEMAVPGWRALLTNAVAVQLDYASRKRLPGFLSESYTGEDLEYGSHVGIPEIAVSPKNRNTDAASLYTLGTAYMIAPDAVERFLSANWPVVSGLMTEHGPWEGYNVARREPIRFQTTAHTAALILGILGTASDNMVRYLESRALNSRLAEVFRPGAAADLLAGGRRVYAWSQWGDPIQFTRDAGRFRVTGARVHEVTVALMTAGDDGVNLSGGELRIGYRSAGPATAAVLTLRAAADVPPRAGLIPQEIFISLEDTGGQDAEVRLPLPATPGLTAIKEVVMTLGRGERERPIDLTVTRLEFAPYAPTTPGR